MKSFKDIRSNINEEYYTGPTAYVGGDRTNVGDIAGSDLGGLANGGARKPYATQDDMGVLSQALNQELFGVHQDPVAAIAKAGTKFSSTGLVFEINANEIRNAMKSNGSYTTRLTFGGHPLGEAPDTNPADNFAAKEIGIVDKKGYETTLPDTSVTFNINPVGTGYKVTAEFV
jgi:hypothetical protein